MSELEFLLVCCLFLLPVSLQGVHALGVVAPSVTDIKADAGNLSQCGAVLVMLPGCRELELLL